MRHLMLAALATALIAPVAFAQQDVSPPELVEFNVDTPVVDTSSGPATAQVTLRVVG